MINTHLRANGIELTEAVESYVTKKVEVLDRFTVNTDADLYAELSKTTAHHKQGDVFRAEFDLKINGKQFRSEAEGNDLYAAIDEAKDEILEKVRTEKDKGDTMFRRGARKIKSILRFGS